MRPDSNINKYGKSFFWKAVIFGYVLLGCLFWAARTASAEGVLLLFASTVVISAVSLTVYRRGRRKRLHEAAVYGDLLNQVNDSILLVSESEPYRILAANQSAHERLGYTREELLELHAGDIADIRAAEGILRKAKHRDTEGQTFCLEINYRTKDNRNIPVEASIRHIRFRGKRALLAIARDLTERKQMEYRIRHMAYYDDLTGLPNRRLFRERLQITMEETHTGEAGLAVMYMDIDQFKLVNDSFGHDYGDMLLMLVAERFTRCVGEDDFLARTEGDEFAIFYSGVSDPEQIAALAGRVGKELEKPFLIGEYQIHITASIGISHYTGDPAENAYTMMKYADIALSRSKEKGKNNFQIFDSGMNSISLNRLTMENELRRAILQNEFALVYQPQMELDSGAIVGMEALIRWHHPARGPVSPGEFIPVAEETGLIAPIGEWVIHEACKQNRMWQEAGHPAVPVSVNLSLRQFLQPDLKGIIESILVKTGLPAQYLELEITESMTMDVELAAKLLLELKAIGVKISIDDFGTGYSSLYLLKKFPIDKLKIDRSFVRDIMMDPNDAAIVTTIISMTRNLNLKVIAEGVETEEQMNYLRKNRCNQIQGYWFSPPISPSEMEGLMKNHQGWRSKDAKPEEAAMDPNQA